MRLNRKNLVELFDRDGVVLKSGPIAIGFYDPVSGKSLPLARVQDAAPQLVAPNQVLFADAFDNLHADYEVTYRQEGMSAEVILREAPTLPAGFSDRTRLEVIPSSRRTRRRRPLTRASCARKPTSPCARTPSSRTLSTNG